MRRNPILLCLGLLTLGCGISRAEECEAIPDSPEQGPRYSVQIKTITPTPPANPLEWELFTTPTNKMPEALPIGRIKGEDSYFVGVDEPVSVLRLLTSQLPGFFSVLEAYGPVSAYRDVKLGGQWDAVTHYREKRNITFVKDTTQSKSSTQNVSLGEETTFMDIAIKTNKTASSATAILTWQSLKPNGVEGKAEITCQKKNKSYSCQPTALGKSNTATIQNYSISYCLPIKTGQSLVFGGISLGGLSPSGAKLPYQELAIVVSREQ